MGIKRNIADLITEVRQLADMQNTQFVTDAEIVTFLLAGYREAHNALAKSYNDWNVSSDDITTDGSREYSIPSDFIRLRKVMYVTGYGTASEREYPCHRVNWMETDGNPYNVNTARRFQLRGSVIRFFPVPGSGLYYRVYYTAAPTAFTSGSTDVEFEFGMDRFIVWDAVVRCLVKEKTDTKEAAQERGRHLADLIISSDPRDASEAMTIQQVQYDTNEYLWEY